MTPHLTSAPVHRSIRTWAFLPIALATALLAACGDKSGGEGKATQAAARVNSSEITVHQINQVLERQKGLTPEQTDASSRQILENLINQQLAVNKAEEQKLDRDPQIVQMLEAARRNILASAYLERSAAAGTGTPSAEDVRKYYDANPALFSDRKVYALQEFTVPGTREEAQAAINKLKETKTANDFIEVLKGSGLKFNATQTTQAAEGLPMNILEPLGKVRDGQALYITAPDGFKAILVIASKSQPVAFDQAKPAIEQFLTTQRRREFTQNEIKGLRAAAKIEYIGKFAEKPAASAPSIAASVTDAAAASSGAGLDANALSKGLSGLK